MNSYSVCASKWQREVFKRQDQVRIICKGSFIVYWWCQLFQVVKEYIRRAKAWRNRVWEARKEGKPRSYLLSLLVVRAYETSDRRNAQRYKSDAVVSVS